MGNTEITKKCFRLKSVSSIDLQENNCVGVLFSKVAGRQVCFKETATLVFSFAC